jgi:hypothetical protein
MAPSSPARGFSLRVRAASVIGEWHPLQLANGRTARLLLRKGVAYATPIFNQGTEVVSITPSETQETTGWESPLNR